MSAQLALIRRRASSASVTPCPARPRSGPHHGAACRRLRAPAPACHLGRRRPRSRRQPDGPSRRSVRPADRDNVPQSQRAACPRLPGRRPRHHREGPSLRPCRCPLIAARDNKQDAFDAITAVIPLDRFLATVEEAEALARSEEFDAYQMLGEHYAGIRRWAPTFLDAFVFQGVPAAAALMRAIDMLRDMNRRAVLTLPKSAPISFIRERWARHVLRGGGIDRRYYELCVLSELRNRLRAGDVWVAGSRRYRAFEERLISSETLKELERDGTLPIAVDADFERFISARRALLDERLAATDVNAKGGLLPDVMLDKGVRKITPLEKSTPPEAEDRRAVG